jgi:hypothetical protein
MKPIALVICLAGLSPILWAAGLPTGTWLRRANRDGISSTMFVEATGTGQKFTFKVRVGEGGTSTMIVTTLQRNGTARTPQYMSMGSRPVKQWPSAWSMTAT